MIAKKRDRFFPDRPGRRRWASADEGECSSARFAASGADAVYKISAPAGLPVQIEAPAEIASAKVGDPAASSCGAGRSLWVRPAAPAADAAVRFAPPRGLFLFELSSGTGGREAAYHAGS